MRLPERLPARLPLVLFAVLALATVGAFYLTQHLKTANPLINGGPRADPAVIDPRYAGTCPNNLGKQVSFRSTSIGFYLQSKSDDVSVYVVNSQDFNVATMTGSGRYLHAAENGSQPYAYFSWDGRLANGTYAPNGTYTFRALLAHQGRTLTVQTASGVEATVQVQSSRPTPRVSSITVQDTPPVVTPTTTNVVTTPTVTAPTTPAGATPSFTPVRQSATINLVPGKYRTGNVLVYRATGNAANPLRLVKTFGINPRIKTAVWDGTINGKPAPAGTYLLGLRVTNRSCTSGQFPRTEDPAPHSTAGAGVNVSYLSADPPMNPVSAGQLASVGIDAGGGAYTWALRRAGRPGVVFHGRSTATTLRVRMPGAGLYDLSVVAGGRRTSVPLVASAVGARAAAKVLVVLPALSWQGANATDDDSDGLIDTMENGSHISLERPLVAGLPSGFADEAALLNFLDTSGLSYDVTTDVALAEGIGPSLKGRSGVLLDGTFTWLPTQLESQLRSFVNAGGGAFADDIHSLQSVADISDGTHGPIAGPAKATTLDPFGVRHGAVASSDGQIIAEQTDGLNLFTDAPALQFPSYQVLTPANGGVVSAAGVAASALSIVGLHFGSGLVVEAGLPDFGSSLSSDVQAGALLGRVWQAVLQ